MFEGFWIIIGILLAIPVVLVILLALFLLQGVFVSVLTEYQEQLIASHYNDFDGTKKSRIKRLGIDCFLLLSGIIIFFLPVKAIPCIEVSTYRDRSRPWNMGPNSVRWYKWFARPGFNQFTIAYNDYEVCNVIKNWGGVWYAYGIETRKDIIVRVGFSNEMSTERLIYVANYYNDLILQSISTSFTKALEKDSLRKRE